MALLHLFVTAKIFVTERLFLPIFEAVTNTKSFVTIIFVILLPRYDPLILLISNVLFSFFKYLLQGNKNLV